MIYRLKLSVIMLGQYHFNPACALEAQVFYFFVLWLNSTFLAELFIWHIRSVIYNLNYMRTVIIGICIYPNITIYHNTRMSFFTVAVPSLRRHEMINTIMHTIGMQASWLWTMIVYEILMRNTYGKDGSSYCWSVLRYFFYVLCLHTIAICHCMLYCLKSTINTFWVEWNFVVTNSWKQTI